jgi:hypothetical protein
MTKDLGHSQHKDHAVWDQDEFQPHVCLTTWCCTLGSVTDDPWLLAFQSSSLALKWPQWGLPWKLHLKHRPPPHLAKASPHPAPLWDSQLWLFMLTSSINSIGKGHLGFFFFPTSIFQILKAVLTSIPFVMMEMHSSWLFHMIAIWTQLESG